MTALAPGRTASITSFRGRVAALLERSHPRDVVVLAVDGLPHRLAERCWPDAVTEPLASVLPTTSSAAWLSSLTGLAPGDHGVPGVVFADPDGSDALINAFDYRGDRLTAADGTVFSDAADLGYRPLAVPADLDAYPCAWRDALLRHAEIVPGHRFYTLGDGPYRPRDPATVVADVGRAIDEALGRNGPRFVWCFVELDRHVHHHGYDEHVSAALDGLGALARRLAGAGAVVVAHSDHGLVPTRHDPDLQALLDDLLARHGARMGGAGRVRWLYCTAVDPLVRDLERALPPSIRVVDSDLLLPPGSLARSRIGPVSLVADGELFLTDPAYTHDHGSDADDEVLTPFAVWEPDRTAAGGTR